MNWEVDMMFLDTSFLVNDEIRLCLQKTTDENIEKGWLPAYHFAICDTQGQEMGACDLRIGHNSNTYYGGNIGYRIHEKYRGHHYAGKRAFCYLNWQKSTIWIILS